LVAYCETNIVAVYPATGWWRSRGHLKRYNSTMRYSLIVSLSTPSVEVPLYTTIKNMIKPAVMVEI